MILYESSRAQCAVCGCVVGTEPLTIKIDQKIVLGARNLLLTDTVTALSSGALRPALAVGDKVVLLPLDGEKYIVAGRIALVGDDLC